jgi:hypothetical protein
MPNLNALGSVASNHETAKPGGPMAPIVLWFNGSRPALLVPSTITALRYHLCRM